MKIGRLAIPKLLHPFCQLVKRKLTLILKKNLPHLIGC